MIKIQLAYKVTGEDEEKVIEEVEKIKEIFEEKGNEIYIPILDPDQPEDKKGIFLDALEKIKSADVVISLVKSGDKSEGMLMEVGHALGLGKKVILLVNKCVADTHLRDLADSVVDFDDMDDLYDKLKEVDV